MDMTYFMVLIVFVVLQLFAILSRIPLLALLFGFVGLGLIGFILSEGYFSATYFPLSPYPQLLSLLVSVVCLLSAVKALRR